MNTAQARKTSPRRPQLRTNRNVVKFFNLELLLEDRW